MRRLIERVQVSMLSDSLDLRSVKQCPCAFPRRIKSLWISSLPPTEQLIWRLEKRRRDPPNGTEYAYWCTQSPESQSCCLIEFAAKTVTCRHSCGAPGA